MKNNKSKGKQGEDLACDFLKKKNYKIIQKNIFTPYGEIDLIAKDGEILVFVEVKLRTTKSYGHVLEQLTKQKQERIANSARHYLQKSKNFATDCRFDYIAIFDTGKNFEISHIENAFEVES